MSLTRRNFLLQSIAAPAVITTPGLLMPVRSWYEPNVIINFREKIILVKETLTCESLYNFLKEEWDAEEKNPFAERTETRARIDRKTGTIQFKEHS